MESFDAYWQSLLDDWYRTSTIYTGGSTPQFIDFARLPDGRAAFLGVRREVIIAPADSGL